MKEELAKCTRWSLWLAAAAFSLGAGRAMANEGEECEGDDGHGCICTGEHHGDDEGDDGGCLGGCSLPKCACDAVFDPVSCNGRLFANACVARCAGQSLSNCSSTVHGPPFACDFTYLPVVCSDGEKYANQCIANALGATGCHQPGGCACQFIFDPVK